MRAVDLARRATYEAATLGWRSRAVALGVSRALKHGVVVDDDTDLVIEGFARSGNSLAVAAIRDAQPAPIRIAHHVHAPAHVLEAVRRHKPTLVVIREPAAAARALVESKPFLSLGAALRGWTRFYEPLVAVRERVVFATWEQVHSDLGGVVERINARFGTSLVPPDIDTVAEADPSAAQVREGRGVPLIGRTQGSAAATTGVPSDPRFERAVALFQGLAEPAHD
jgi:hypothetical protein